MMRDSVGQIARALTADDPPAVSTAVDRARTVQHALCYMVGDAVGHKPFEKEFKRDFKELMIRTLPRGEANGVNTTALWDITRGKKTAPIVDGKKPRQVPNDNPVSAIIKSVWPRSRQVKNVKLVGKVVNEAIRRQGAEMG
jgi:hypothetical protein